MSKEEISTISEQRNQVFHKGNDVELVSACSIGDGILKVNEDVRSDAELAYNDFDGVISFFVPASGSGSRMFKFLHEYVNTRVETKETKEFFSNINDFAFVKKLPLRVKEKIGGTENTSIAEYLLSSAGMNFGSISKGLIPFHVSDDQVMNPFQTQLVQSSSLIKNNGVLHFTVQSDFEEQVKESLRSVVDVDVQFEFSQQSAATDAFCFDKDQMPIIENGNYLRRPAGHGALLENLNSIDADIILIKNIDNVQPIGKESDSKASWKLVSGCLINFKKELLELSKSYSREGLERLNDKFQFLTEDQVEVFKEADLNLFLNRPTRVCGMVKNEGAPGGGPFWVRDGAGVTKQIVEISQVNQSVEQQSIVAKSSHFNPVFMAVSSRNSYNEMLNLMDFIDESKFLKVKKPHKGREIFYRELPGLWNGAMANWNTIFIELPSTIFSPVKSVLDLLYPPHK